MIIKEKKPVSKHTRKGFEPILHLSSDWLLAKRFMIKKKLCSHDIICSAEGKNINNITSDDNLNHILKQQLNSAVPIHKGEESK